MIRRGSTCGRARLPPSTEICLICTTIGYFVLTTITIRYRLREMLDANELFFALIILFHTIHIHAHAKISVPFGTFNISSLVIVFLFHSFPSLSLSLSALPLRSRYRSYYPNLVSLVAWLKPSAQFECLWQRENHVR